jgi:aminoglycoside phosphotransferase (APT) family kinase protein
MSSAVPAALGGWLRGVLPDRGPFTWERLTAGTSNQTYRLHDESGALILQRPPTVALDSSAHNVERQYRLLAALDDLPVPTPAAVALCTDREILGAPFMVVEAVDGATINDVLPPGAPPAPEAARQIGAAMVDALAAIHAVDWGAVGLGDFGRPEGFLARQVPRWTKHYRRIQVRELPAFDRVAAWLEASRPAEPRATIMHGDFHLTNCLVDFAPGARVEAVIDWEMATIGDPLLDLGGMLVFWGPDRPSEPAMPRLQAVSRVAGAPSRSELAARYAEASGRSVADLDYYMVLAGWKLAAIMESAYANFSRGRAADETARRMERDVPALLDEVAAIAGPATARRR